MIVFSIVQFGNNNVELIKLIALNATVPEARDETVIIFKTSALYQEETTTGTEEIIVQTIETFCRFLA